LLCVGRHVIYSSFCHDKVFFGLRICFGCSLKDFLGEEITFLGEEIGFLGEEIVFLGEEIVFLGEEIRFLGEEIRFLGEGIVFLGEENLHGMHRKKFANDEQYILRKCSDYF